MLRAGKAKESYSLLAPHEYEMAGNIEYDYLLGVAALDSGNPAMATLALERVLSVSPDHAGARLDLARAYFALGDIERAKTEFTTAQSQNPPPAAKNVIEQYLAAIDKTQNPGMSVTGYLEGTMGHDTNVNTATSSSQIFIPLFGTSLTMDSASLAAKDEYISVGAGLEATKPLKPGLSLFAGLDTKKRVNFDKDIYNTGDLGARVGLNVSEGMNAFRLSAQRAVHDIDDRLNNRTNSISGEWRRTLDTRNIVSLFGQYGRLRYGHDKNETDLSYNNVDQSVAGLGWLHAFDDYGKNIAFASLYGGYENTTEDTTRIDGDQKFHGIRLGGQRSLGEKLDAICSIGYKKGKYQLQNLLIQDFRQDHQLDLTLALNWKYLPDWTVKPQISYTRNNSNSGLNAYHRTDASITVRREFK